MDTPPNQRRKTRRTIACDECKRRKVKCSGEQKCANCIRDEKACTYSTPQQRMSTLQRDIDNYERLFKGLKKTWDHHLPDVSLEHAIYQSKDMSQAGGSSNVQEIMPATQPPVPMPKFSPPFSEVTRSSGHMNVHTPEHNNAEEYEFDESQDIDRSIDGMGFLTSESRKSGYTGPQSGISALRFLRSLPLDSRLEVANGEDGSDEIKQQMQSRRHSVIDVNNLIDDYFTLYHPLYPLLHEGLFRARLSGAVPKPRDGSWPLLYNMVVAIGAFVGDSDNSSTDLEFYRTARESISLSVLEKGSLGYVQGLMIMANYLQKRNKPNAGFALVGIAWSMAMSIGLHREFRNTSTTPFTMELRRRAWWTLFVFVSAAQLTVGRPPASLIGVNLNHPLNVRDGDLVVDMEIAPAEIDGPTVTSSLIAQIKLATIANDIQAELLTNQVPVLETASHLDGQIVHWASELPLYFQSESNTPTWFQQPKHVLVWRSHHLRIVLNRPFLFQAVANDAELDSENQRISSCLQTADTCVESICHFFSINTECKRGFAWYATYWLITASFVHATCLAYSPIHALAPQWKNSIERAAQALQTLGRVHLMAGRARSLLHKLLDRYQSIDTSSQADSDTQAPFDPGILMTPFSNFQHPGEGPYNSGPYESVNEPMPFDSAMDLSWLWSQGPNAEFLDAAGGITLQSYQDSWL